MKLFFVVVDSETMETATGRKRQSKRARFDDTVLVPETGSGKPGMQSPMQTAISYIESYVQVSLHPQAATIFSNLAKDHVADLAKAYNKLKQAQKMETDVDAVPRSARHGFELRVARHMTTDPICVGAKLSTTELTKQYQKDLKKEIVLVTKQEGHAAEKQCIRSLAHGLRQACAAFRIIDSTNVDIDILVNTLLDRYHDRLLKHTCPNDLEEFRVSYKEQFGLATLPNPEPKPTNHHAALAPACCQPVVDHSDSLGMTLYPAMLAARGDTEGAREFLSPTPEPATAAAAAVIAAPQRKDAIEYARVVRILESLFIAPWDSYLRQVKDNQVTLELKKLGDGKALTKATEEVAMELDREIPADRGLLIELIRKTTQAETKKLQDELRTLRQSQGKTDGKSNNAKKSSGRGQPSQGASRGQNQKQNKPTNAQQGMSKLNTRATTCQQSQTNPTNTSTPSKPRRVPRNQRNVQADDAVNALSNANKSKRTQQSKQQSNTKQPASRIKKRSCSQASGKA